jgi:FKBP-type peptidyl-prolyl cis-trans isomerase FkpA
MKFVKTVFCILAVILVLAACKNVDYQKTKGGVAYKIIPGGKSKDSIKEGAIVKYNMIMKVVGNGKDSVISNSYETMPRYEEVRPGPGSYAENVLPEIFMKAKVGDSIYFEQSVDSFITKQPDLLKSTNLKLGDKLVTSARILSVLKTPADADKDSKQEYETNRSRILKFEEKQYEKNMKTGLENYLNTPAIKAQLETDNKNIETYLAKNNIKAEKTAMGVYIERIAPGQGPKPKYGQFSIVKYKGYLLSGVVFDPGLSPYNVEIGRSQVVPGFMDGVSQLTKGEKARIFIPSVFGYALQGRGETIKPNENLIFDMEVLDITDKQPEQQPLQKPDSLEGKR